MFIIKLIFIVTFIFFYEAAEAQNISTVIKPELLKPFEIEKSGIKRIYLRTQ